jgi:hypothetical protein
VKRFIRIGIVAALGVVLAACGSPRLLIATGTTIGLKATPGDGQARPPQVTFAYKRAEVAVVPTPEKPAERGAKRDEDGNLVQEAYSTLAAFSFFTKWWGETRLDSVVATGHAARELHD